MDEWFSMGPSFLWETAHILVWTEFDWLWHSNIKTSCNPVNFLLKMFENHPRPLNHCMCNDIHNNACCERAGIKQNQTCAFPPFVSATNAMTWTLNERQKLEPDKDCNLNCLVRKKLEMAIRTGSALKASRWRAAESEFVHCDCPAGAVCLSSCTKLGTQNKHASQRCKIKRLKSIIENTFQTPCQMQTMLAKAKSNWSNAMNRKRTLPGNY